MFEKTDKIISKTMGQKGLDKVAVSARVCFEAEKIINEIFPKMKKQINIDNFTNDILKISSSNSAINQEIQFKKSDLIKKINQQLGSDLVKNVRFGIK